MNNSIPGILINHSSSGDELEGFLTNNISTVNNFVRTDFQYQYKVRFDVDDYIILNSSVISELDFSKYYNSLFVLTLLDYCEKFLLPGPYQELYKIATQRNLNIGKRQQSAKIFLVDIKKQQEHLNYAEEIISKLSEAIKADEDDGLAVIITFSNYLINIANNTADVDDTIITAVLKKLRSVSDKYCVLSHPIAKRILCIEYKSVSDYCSSIKKVIESFQLAQSGAEINDNNIVFEIDSDYAKAIGNVPVNFKSYREISRENFNKLSESEKGKVWWELERGVKIIDSEIQLFGYMTYYGAKHFTKLDYSFTNFHPQENQYNIIDWACGQALASMVFMDKYGTSSINKIVLNEPSALALARAGLHLSKYLGSSKVKLVNKDIESLESFDISTGNNLPNIHLFSNILDVDLDFAHLTQLISTTFSGNNYFVCVSPYIKDINTSRIDLFVDYFQKKYQNSFNSLQSCNIKSGDPTMVIRIFSVTLN